MRPVMNNRASGIGLVDEADFCWSGSELSVSQWKTQCVMNSHGGFLQCTGVLHQHIGHHLIAGRVVWRQGNHPLHMSCQVLCQLCAHDLACLLILLSSKNKQWLTFF